MKRQATRPLDVGWVFFPLRVAVLGVGVLLALLGGAVFLLRPDRSQNRRFAFACFLNALEIGLGEGAMYLLDDPRDAYALQLVAYAILPMTLWAELRLYASLEGPIARALRPRAVSVATLALALAACALVVLRPGFFLGAIVPAVAGKQAVWDVVNAPGAGVLFSATLVVVACGSLTALTAVFANVRGRRSASKLYLAAFLVRDAGYVAVLSTYFGLGDGSDLAGVFGLVAFLAFMPIIAYAVLRAQLFDIDLRFKRGIRRGTLAAIFVAVFFVVAQLIQNVATQVLGYVAGAVAAGLLLFALAPLQRVAERVADAAMPRVAATPEYFAFRKHEVYRQAVRDAQQDGIVTPRERAVLDGLVRSLEIDPAVAREIEGALGAPSA